MSVKEILNTVEFVVDSNGNPKAALLDIAVWDSFRAWLDDQKDEELIQSRIAGWPDKQNWSRWEEFEAELEENAVPFVGS